MPIARETLLALRVISVEVLVGALLSVVPASVRANGREVFTSSDTGTAVVVIVDVVRTVSTMVDELRVTVISVVSTWRILEMQETVPVDSRVTGPTFPPPDMRTRLHVGDRSSQRLHLLTLCSPGKTFQLTS